MSPRSEASQCCWIRARISASPSDMASPERIGGLLAVVSESAGLAIMRSEHRPQEDTGTQDDDITDSRWEQPGDPHEPNPEPPGKDEPLPLGSSAMAVDGNAPSAAKLGFA